MSGSSYDSSCPNCGDNIDVYSDYKPYDTVSVGPCKTCGFHSYNKSEFLTLNRLNAVRKEWNELQGLVAGDEDFLRPLTNIERPTKNKWL